MFHPFGSTTRNKKGKFSCELDLQVVSRDRADRLLPKREDKIMINDLHVNLCQNCREDGYVSRASNRGAELTHVQTLHEALHSSRLHCLRKPHVSVIRPTCRVWLPIACVGVALKKRGSLNHCAYTVSSAAHKKKPTRPG
jgi:hypothetical protein